jgi:hypothetical protein
MYLNLQITPILKITQLLIERIGSKKVQKKRLGKTISAKEQKVVQGFLERAISYKPPWVSVTPLRPTLQQYTVNN